MSQFLLYYQRPDPTTWAYLSSLLTIGLYFVFHRFWSVRNLDLVLLILLAPGLLMVNEGRKRQLAVVESNGVPQPLATAEQEPPSAADPDAAAEGDTLALRPASGPVVTEERSMRDAQVIDAQVIDAQVIERRGFIWLLGVELLILMRLLVDPMMVRRPLLDPNLTTGGLNFIGIAMLIFLLANVITSTPRHQQEQGPQLGPGYPLVSMLPTIPTIPEQRPPVLRESEEPSPEVAYAALARAVAIVAHLGVMLGITLIGYWHFGNMKAGVGCATLYLLLPYTAQMTGRVDHVLPAAMLIWAVLMYRRPALAGIFMGLAAGLVYYPLFLLPLWFSFYWQRGVRRFALGVVGTLAALTLLLSLVGTHQMGDQLQQMYGLWRPTMHGLKGVWGLGWSPIWRLPLLVAFFLLSGLYAVWPGQKNLGTLMSCSAALMVAAQFWHGYGGGLYMAWFVPLLLLTVFRPNLEDRVALRVVAGG